jgi:hypothetical protein
MKSNIPGHFGSKILTIENALKHYYFNNTNHGGSYGNGGKSTDGTYSCATVSGDHCRPLMRLCQRSLLWKLGIGESYFNSMERKKDTIASNREVEETYFYQEDNSTMFGVL